MTIKHLHNTYLLLNHKHVIVLGVQVDPYLHNREGTDPVEVLEDFFIHDLSQIDQLYDRLVKEGRNPFRFFLGFNGMYTGEVFQTRKRFRQVFKLGHLLGYDFLKYKLSRIYLELAELYRENDGYSIAIQSNERAAFYYQQSLNWWPMFATLSGLGYLNLFGIGIPQNKKAGELYFLQTISPSPATLKYARPNDLALYRDFATRCLNYKQ